MVRDGWGPALRRGIAGLLAACATGVQADAPPAAPPAPEAFFAPGPLQMVRLSPSGRWLASIVTPKDGRAQLVITDVDDKVPGRIVAKFSRADVVDVTWVNEDWLVFEVDDPRDKGGNWVGTGLLSVRRDGERTRTLIRPEWDTLYAVEGSSQPLQADHSMMGLGAPGSNEIIVGKRRLDARYRLASIDPIALDVATGARRSLVAKAPPNATGWLFDGQGRPRAAAAVDDDSVVLHWREPASEDWQVVGRYKQLDISYWPAFIDDQDRLFVHGQTAEGYATLLPFDRAKGEPMGEALVQTPGFSDSIAPIRDRRDGRLIGLNLLTDARQQYWLSPEMQAIKARVDATLPGRANHISCGACDKPDVVLVHSTSDRHPGEYLLHWPAANRWQRVGALRPDIDPARMAGMSFHRIQARDGAELPLWVTRHADAKPRPAVVLVHGGPWVRGAHWHWDAEVQFLASRGYVVIEPEFRGSTGYGDKHYRRGWKQWGQAMQDDVTDALRFAVKSGWVDPQRVCIVGASYGGYATLMGLAKDPDQYRCGVAWVGVTDPRLMFSIHWSDLTDNSKRVAMPQLVGDPKADATMLAANAPVELAGRIKAPVLLAYGSLDRRVPIEHGEQMRAALRKAGNEPEWIVYGDEGHGWRRLENTLDFWRRADAFLARHLMK